MNKNKLHLKDYLALAAIIIVLAAMGLDIQPDPECTGITLDGICYER
jgi:hypothetical protein